MFVIIDHLYTAIVVSTLLFIFLTLGSHILSRCGIIFEQALDTLLFSLAIGGGLLASGLLFLGTLIGFHKLILFIFLLFFVFIARNQLRNSLFLIKETVNSLRKNAHVLSLLIFLLASSFMICMALAPPTDNDSLRLHLRVPSQFLEKGVIYLPEDNLAASFVQLAHMWYVPLLAFAGVTGPALLNTFLALAFCLASFSFSLHFLNAQTASLSLACFWANTVILLVAITARVDVTLSFFLFLGHYALLRVLVDPSQLRLFYLAAALLGFAAGIKYNAIFYILAVCPLIIWIFYLGIRNYSWSIKELFIFGALLMISASPWLIKNIFQFQAPLYPFFTERQTEPWLNHLNPYSSQVSSVIKAGIADSLQRVAQSFDLIEFIKDPGRLMVEWEGRFYTFNIIFFVLPLWFLAFKKYILNMLVISVILYMIMLIVFWPFSNIRYLIPAFIPLTMLGCHIMEEIFGRMFKSPRRRKTYLYLFACILLLSPTIAMCYWPYSKGAIKYLIGSCTQEDYLRAEGIPTGLYADVASFINENLSEKDKVLLILESRGLYFRVPVIQDNELSNWPLLLQKKVTPKELREVGISHILINTIEARGLQSRGMNIAEIRLEEFRFFGERCLVPIYENEGYILYSMIGSNRVEKE